MKKIVMICNHFAPDNMIAAVRTTKIAKYLRENGYEVTVVAEQKYGTQEDDILRNDAEGITVIRVANTSKVKTFISTYKKIMEPVKNKRFNNLDNRMRINKKKGKYEFYPFEVAYPFLGSLDYLVELLRQYDLCKQARVYLSQHQDASCFFTSYGDFFSFFTGKYLKKRYTDIPWIFDIRDSICQYKFTPKYVKWYPNRVKEYIAQNADCIIGVSKGICRQIPNKYRYKVHCVTNGYDRNDRKGIEQAKKEVGKLKFAYTGAMYGGIRNLSPFFEVLKKLIDNGIVSKEKIEVYYAGKESAYEIFKGQAKGFLLDDICLYCGQVTRKESLKIQVNSDILLVSSHEYETDYESGTDGMITGKALEYMSADKPMVAIINGDIRKSELADIIRDGRLGFAYQEINHEKDSIGLYEFLCDKYKELSECGKTSHNPDEKVVRKYNYQFICKRLLNIIEAIE